MTATSKCIAIACSNNIPSQHLMCNRHWRMCPKRTRRKIWRNVVLFAALMLHRIKELVDIVAAKEINSLSDKLCKAESQLHNTGMELSAIRQGPHAHAALLAAKLAVHEMMERNAGR